MRAGELLLQLGPAAVRQLTWAAIGPLLLFNYVQQPDRALWNFAFVVMPAAAVMLDRVAAPFGWALVAMQALAGLRIGAQLPFAPSLRLTLLGAIMCGFAVAARAYRQPQPALQSS